MSTVFAMVKQVLADSKEKLAAQQTKTASDGERALGEQPSNGTPTHSDSGPPAEKVASALDYLAENIHLVADTRTPHEKLAEYQAIAEAMTKRAMGDESQGPHQTQKAPPAYQSPMSPGMSGEQMGAGGNQVESGGNTREADGVMEAGQSGQAGGDSQSPQSVSPTENTFPGDQAGNALESTQDEADRPGGKETAPMKIAQARAQHLTQMVACGQLSEKTAAFIIKQDQVKVAGLADTAGKAWGAVRGAAGKAGGAVRGAAGKAGAAIKGTPGRYREAGRMTREAATGKGSIGTGAMTKMDRLKALGGAAKKVAPELAVAGAAGTGLAAHQALKKEAERSGVPPVMANVLLKKLAADAENPASISAGTTPELQTAAGANPAQSQGTEAGEGVPGTKGGDQGREAIQSVMAAINATKDDVKGKRTRSEMSKYLDNPAFSKGQDSVLQQSLENASSAGVKIAATKAMLQKWASESPERQAQLHAAMSKVKQANEMMGYGAQPQAAAAPPMGGAGGQAAPAPTPLPGGDGAPKTAMGAEGAMPVSDAALAAAAAGVDPEEVARAEVMLAEQAQGGAPEAMPEPEGAPPMPPPPAEEPPPEEAPPEEGAAPVAPPAGA